MKEAMAFLYELLLTASTSAALLAGLAFLLRHWIQERLTRSVQHAYDVKIEALRAEFRRDESVLRARLDENSSGLQTLHRLTAERTTLVDKRRQEAAESLWACALELKRQTSAVGMMEVVKFKEALKLTAENEKARELFKQIFAKAEVPDFHRAELQRPFIGDAVWGHFEAYRGIVAIAVTKAKLLGIGMQYTEDVFSEDVVAEKVKQSLPHSVAFVDEWGTTSTFLLQQIERRLLESLRIELGAKNSTSVNVEAIVDGSVELMLAQATAGLRAEFPNALRGKPTPEQGRTDRAA